MPALSVPPRVFISYSHDSRQHEDAVLNLSDRLRTDGIDCSLDQYVSNPPEGWVTWMQNQTENSDYVLLICTEIYGARLEKNEEPGIGLGAIWEGQLIFNDLYRRQGLNSKYIPVLRSHEMTVYSPNSSSLHTL